MVLRKASWLVAFGISVGGLDSFLCGYSYEEFFDRAFNAFDNVQRAFCVRVQSPAGSFLEAQFLLPNTIRSVEPSLHLQEVRGCQSARASR